MVQTYDLTKLADRLRSDAKFSALATTIDSWTHRNSRLADLRHAQDLLETLIQQAASNTGPGGLLPAINANGDIEGALFAQAVILYGRATKEQGDTGRRHAFDLRTRYSPEQQALHEELTMLRNRAIAHYDSNSRQTWMRGHALLQIHSKEDWEYGFAFSHTLHASTLNRRFSDLLVWLTPLLEQELKSDNDILHQQLELAFDGGRDFQEHVAACSFDPQRFFGRGEAAKAIEEAMKAPGGKFTANVRFPINRNEEKEG